MRKLLLGIAVVLAAIAVYLLIAPIGVAPVAWQPQPMPPLNRGIYMGNHLLAGIERIDKGAGRGPEAIAIGSNGALYTGFEDGSIVGFRADRTNHLTIAQTQGRPLGLKFHPNTSLIVCDAKRGLLRVDGDRVDTLTDEADGVHFGFCNDLAISKDGYRVYFTDSSSKFGYGHSTEDIVEHGGKGRFLLYDFSTKTTKRLLEGLQFPNGVAMGPEDEYLLVTETGNYRVLRYWLNGPKAGSFDIFADNLPGFPDNITFNGRDRFWLALYAPRTPLVDSLAGSPFLRKVELRALRYLPAPVKNQAFVLGFDTQGKLIANLQDDGNGAYAPITSVIESADGYLYLGSLSADSIGRIKLPTLPAGLPN